MFKTWKQFLTWEKASHDTIDFKTIYVDVVGKRGLVGNKKNKKGEIENGDIISGLLLSQIVYWYLPNKNGESKLKVKKHGHHWIVKKIDEWYDEIRLTPANYRTAMKRLEEEDLVIKKSMKDPFDRDHQKTATHIRLNIPEFMKRLGLILAALESDVHDVDDEDFNEYIEEQMNAESLSPLGNVESTIPDEPLSPLGNVESTIPIGNVESTIPGNVESTRPLYKESTFKENTSKKNTYYSSSSINRNNTKVYKETKNRKEDDDKKLNQIISSHDGIALEALYNLLLHKDVSHDKARDTVLTCWNNRVIEFSLEDVQKQYDWMMDKERNGETINSWPVYFANGLKHKAEQTLLSNNHYRKKLREHESNRENSYKREYPFYNWIES
ncbi:hypothetical protein [Bacillus taeanensis]|uniref:Uncharacterized protein n=1 Tax=Bacillus taeanensis TaxID=273032 RepID=A0A366XQ47_9BACI|nr:hypothetical protein [Bacillus taeanensis]RBW68242.1 hypothetical protein DS031_17865 [Bacillus taeanensis]